MLPSSKTALIEAGGLRPKRWLCIGSGFGREEIKSALQKEGLGWRKEAITNLSTLVCSLLKVESLLGGLSRQEIIGRLLSERSVQFRFPELRKLRRRAQFLKRLDRAIQAGRMAFSHGEEEKVFDDRLLEEGLFSPKREELRLFSLAYETYLESQGLYDLPFALKKAISLLEVEWPGGVQKPESLTLLSLQVPESLEKSFWDALGRWVSFDHARSLYFGMLKEAAPEFQWIRAHTLDDAAEFLVDELSLSSLEECAILIPDHPQTRRSLQRAFKRADLPLADPRDPTLLRWEEAVKVLCLPLEMVSKSFERQSVLSYLRLSPNDSKKIYSEIQNRAIQRGLSSYRGRDLEELYGELVELQAQFGGRKTVSEISQAHLAWMKKSLIQAAWLFPFFEMLWSDLALDLKRVGKEEQRLPTGIWAQRLVGRLREGSPPSPPLKPEGGLKLYRLQQLPTEEVKKVYLFGMPPNWLSRGEVGDDWFSEREREVLGSDFQVRSSHHTREEKFHLFSSWLNHCESMRVYDACYESQGQERESIGPLLQELSVRVGAPWEITPLELGAHPRFVGSYASHLKARSTEVLLPPTPCSVKPELTATALDSYSRCPFQALVYHRWKLRDVREPGIELWSEVKGQILHEAVKLLLKSLTLDRNFALSPEDALLQAWRKKPIRGLFQTSLTEQYHLTRLSQVLTAFCEKEKEYLKRSEVTPFSLEETRLKLEFDQVRIVGQPDRLDRHRDGLFVMDYKSSGETPHGEQMLQSGYRLQLPFYAIAAAKHFNESVLGLQFIELNGLGQRKSGLFFKGWNGKDPGSLTHLRSNSKSLMEGSPDEAWQKLEGVLEEKALGFVRGNFSSQPTFEKDCQRCHVSDLCGARRRSKDAS